MWILNWLPDWVFHAIMMAGILGIIASYALKVVPFISTYGLPVQIVSIALIVIGVWYEGGMAKDIEWRAKVKEVEAKVAAAEIKSSEANVQIVTKFVKRIELVKTRGDDIVKYVDREVVKYDNTCPVPVEVIKALNAAALNQSMDAVK